MVSVEGSNVAKALVLDTFKPRVAVLCSPAAQSICEKNNLQFTQLIQPFSALTTDLTWLEPNGQSITPRNLRICPVDLSTWKPSEQDTQRNRRILNNVVTQNPAPLSIATDTLPETFQSFQINGRSFSYTVDVPKSNPWFELWREVFLKLYSEQQQSQHEFLNQFMACILVIAASEVKSSEDVTTVIGKLSKLQLQHQHEWPQTWFLPSVLKFYLILHDNAVDTLTSSEGAYQSLRTTYGGNFCYMLRINSVGVDSEYEPVYDLWSPHVQKEKLTRKETANAEISAVYDDVEPVNPDEPLHPLSPVSDYPRDIVTPNGDTGKPEVSEVRGGNLTVQDTQNIQIAVNEFVGKSLLPYVERQARIMHESILNRRGVSKSFFSATKRLFGTGAKTASSVVYASESPEMLTRKLADLYFLFGHYDGAYQLYHQIKKDFQADAAWLYYASSIEMAALAHFMMTQAEPPMAVTRSFPVHYITEAISHYSDLCRLPEAATRCAIIFCECLKQMGNFGEAAAIFIRMTSEDCDLRSALMLEQAAYAFIKLNSPRKYALHSVLAGHRYAKAGLRPHSLNCYIQAFRIYGGRGWKFAEDHVQYTIARHQAALQIYNGIVERLLSLLQTPTLQSVQQVQMFYKEFITVAAKLYKTDGVVRESFIPRAVCSEIRVLIAAVDLSVGGIGIQPAVDGTADSSLWDSLEEQVVKECIDTSVIIFKPSRLVFDSSTDNTVQSSVPSNETFYVEIPFHNPLSTQIVMRRIGLKFDVSAGVEATVVDTCQLEPGETKTLRFAVLCSMKGMISFESVTYELELGSTSVPLSQKLLLRGPRLNSTLTERCSRVYAKDLRNKINVTGEMPLIQADVENLPSALYHSQCTEFDVVLKDKSRDPRQRQRIAKVVFASENMNKCLEISSSIPLLSTGEVVPGSKKKNYSPFTVAFDGCSSVRIPCVYRVPSQNDVANLNILILYEIKHEDGVKPQVSAFGSVLYRVIKISIRIPLLSSLRCDHSLLKRCDILHAASLLKIQNLAKERSVFIERIEFSPKILTIEGITWKSNEEASESTLQLLPAQSSNVVLRTLVLPEELNARNKDDTLLLCVTWSMQHPQESVTRIKGFHQLSLSKSDIISVPEEAPITFQLRHSSRCKHNFKEFPCFIYPVELAFSCRKSGRLILKVEKDSKRVLESGTQDSYCASSQSVYFVGKTSWSVSVEASQTEKVTYNVALTRPGVYNIAPTISVKYLDDGTQKNYDLHSPFILDQL